MVNNKFSKLYFFPDASELVYIHYYIYIITLLKFSQLSHEVKKGDNFFLHLADSHSF